MSSNRRCLVCNKIYSSNRTRQIYCCKDCRKTSLYERRKNKYNLVTYPDLISLPSERWKWVNGFDNFYKISNQGRVISVDREINRSGKCGNKIRRKGALHKTTKTNTGYLVASLNRKKLLVHRIVAEHFVKNHDNKPMVNHKDGNKLNNNYKNLEWCTQAENNHHASVNGLSAKGESVHGSKLNETTVKQIRQLYDSGKYTQAQLKIMFNYSAISSLVRRKGWKHVK